MPRVSVHGSLLLRGLALAGALLLFLPLPASARTGPVRHAGPPLLRRPLAAVTRTWTGNGGDNKWSTPANWDSGIPQNGDSLTFPAAALHKVNANDIAGLSIAGVRFEGDGYVISGNPITMSGYFFTDDSTTNIVGI